MRTTYVTALVIAVLVIAWLLSGKLGDQEAIDATTLAEQNAGQLAREEDRERTRVRARVIRAERRAENVVIRGQTENKRTVQVMAETQGRVTARPVERGTRVEEGDVLCLLAVDDREAQIEEAKEAVNQARIEYEGSQRLAERGLVSDTSIATSKARLAAAQAQLERAELELARIRVRAPFAGLVEATHVEKGTYVQPGTPCATVLDLDPMLLVGRVAERDVQKVDVGGTAVGQLITGDRVEGTVTFVGKQSDPATRTYPVEVQVPNADYALRSGITTEIRIPLDMRLAHKVSPSLLALDDAGRIGLRTIDEDNRVEFHSVQIVGDEEGAVWVAGLPEVTKLITVGQELVVPGERVDVTLETSGEMPASAPEPARPTAPSALADESGEARVSNRKPHGPNKAQVGSATGVRLGAS